MIPDHLRLQPGQEALTPEQEAEAERFAEERIAAQLSTEPVDEPEAEQLLRQAYAVAGLPSPQQIQWVDGPLQLVTRLSPFSAWDSVGARIGGFAWDHMAARAWDPVVARVRAHVEELLQTSVEESLRTSVAARVQSHIEARVWAGVWGRVRASMVESLRTSGEDITWGLVEDSAAAFDNASWLSYYRFFDVYLAPNALDALAHFNERVSGYWLGKEVALLVRRPRVLVRDQEGRLHCATGKCIEYRDGWGVWAWHGVRVPEQVIVAPERLKREDFLKERDVEVRRVIQERMGSRFMRELGGTLGAKLIDVGPRGRLYEVPLPQDPEQVARYVQVQDTSTERRYFLRVPPTLQTAAEAVAWSFQIGAEDYHPAEET
jgi:hypothetical protein